MNDAVALVPYGSVVAFANECLNPSRRAHCEIGAVYTCYAVWCRGRNVERLRQEPFAEEFFELCHGVGITIRPGRNGLLWVLHTRLAWQTAAALLPPIMPAPPVTWRDRVRGWFRGQ